MTQKEKEPKLSKIAARLLELAKLNDRGNVDPSIRSSLGFERWDLIFRPAVFQVDREHAPVIKVRDGRGRKFY